MLLVTDGVIFFFSSLIERVLVIALFVFLFSDFLAKFFASHTAALGRSCEGGVKAHDATGFVC